MQSTSRESSPGVTQPTAKAMGNWESRFASAEVRHLAEEFQCFHSNYWWDMHKNIYKIHSISDGELPPHFKFKGKSIDCELFDRENRLEDSCYM